MSGLTNSLCARNLYESKVKTCKLHNLKSWIGIKESQTQVLQEFQNNVVFAAHHQGTEMHKGIVEMESNMMLTCNHIKIKMIEQNHGFG